MAISLASGFQALGNMSELVNILKMSSFCLIINVAL
jgi:hypothetical protein